MHVGVIIPARNAVEWIGGAIASMRAQTHPDWTLVVVDDGSTDATAERATSVFDRRLRVIRQAELGVSAARNRGLAALGSEPEALLFLDADDWLAPDALARLGCALAAAPAAVAASGPCGFVMATDGPGAAPWRVKPAAAGDILARLVERNLFANGGQILIRREAVWAAGWFRNDLAFGEDWEYWIRIALRGSFVAATGRDPVVFVRAREAGAYLRGAVNSDSYVACTEAIFANPALGDRMGSDRLIALRARAEAENFWIMGQALLRCGNPREGRAWLRRSAAAKPGLKRLALLAAAHLRAMQAG
jgi:glycosyltransferase involved in cell wall biosynthesis